MFESGFSEGVPHDLSKGKRRIRMMPEDNFDLYKKLLVFIYSSKITFNSETVSSDHSPYLCEAEEIYAIADRLVLSGLISLSLNFLSRSCTTKNIVTRLFGRLSLQHDAIRKIYADFSYEHGEELFQEGALEEFFEKLKEEDDVELLRMVCDWQYHQALRLCNDDRSILQKQGWQCIKYS